MEAATELLISGREALTPEWAWVREYVHTVDEQGRDCYCTFGGLLAWNKGEPAEHPGHDEAWKLLSDEARALGFEDGNVEEGTYVGALTAFNEAPQTTHGDVLALYDRAIDKSKA